MKTNLKRMLVAILCVIPTICNYAQKNDTILKLGDKAPELRVEWIKGTPVKEFSNDKLYVIEFWATWCGPCKAAMPHLSELAREYKDKVTFIGVNIWEKAKAGQPYESVYPAVKEFVAGKGDKMDYNVAIEKNDKYMSTFWMKAAGENGIPSTFLVKEGKVIWIGHPVNLDSTLIDVLAGSYNMETYAKESAEAKAKKEAAMAPLMNLYKTFGDALKAKNYQLALDEIEKARPAIDSNYYYALDNMKLEAYIEFNMPEALKLANKLTTEYPPSKGSIGYMIANKDDLQKEAYNLGVEYLSSLLTDPEMPAPVVYDLVAKCYYKSGDKANAVSFGQKAITEGEKAVKEGSYEGSITEAMVNEYRESLNRYNQVQP